ncbi:MAG: hypothetical protein P1U53_11785 [Sulfitobacter sp.]|nr:hypothetical protein [Sulfitobacter sp.]
MNADEVKEFLRGHSIYALDPETRKVAACIDYRTDGTCFVRFVNGDTDKGVYGFEGDTYWTRYETFREGKRHAFRLVAQGPGVAQAYFQDGTIAFLQSYEETPPDPD